LTPSKRSATYELATQNSANEVVPHHHHLLPSNPRHLHPTAALNLAAATITTVSRPSTVIIAPAGCTRPPQHSLTIDAISRTSVAPFSRCPHQNAKNLHRSAAAHTATTPPFFIVDLKLWQTRANEASL